jgi:hypothetical protein
MDRTTIARRLRIAAAVGALTALWFAASAPFFQGGAIHL